MKNWEDMYRSYQDAIRPEEYAVNAAVKKAGQKTSGSIYYKYRGRTSTGRILITAAAIVICVCMSVPVIAGIADNMLNRSRFDNYTQMHSVDNQYIQYPGKTMECKDVRLSIDRYIRVDNDAIVELTLKNLDDRPGEKYNYRANFASINDDGTFRYMSNGTPSSQSVVITAGTDYDAENNSAHIIYLIKDVPDRLVVEPSSDDIEAVREKAKYTIKIMRQSEEEHDINKTVRLVEESGYYILLDISSSPVYNSSTQGIAVQMDEKDIAQALQNYPHESDKDMGQMIITSVTFTITDFGIEARFKAADAGDNVWQPAVISLVYKDGSVKRIAPGRARYEDIPVKERRSGTDITIVNHCSVYFKCSSDTEMQNDGYINKYWHLDEVIDTTAIEKVIVDGVEYAENY